MKAYIPGSKPEIEAIFDPSVTKGFSPVEFSPGYIVTHGVRVPFTGAYTPVGGSGGSTIPSGRYFLFMALYLIMLLRYTHQLQE